MTMSDNVHGFMLLKCDSLTRYRGVDREPFEPLIFDSVISLSTEMETLDIWAMYPPGWRRDAYRLFSENQTLDSDDILMIQSLDAARAIQQLIPAGEAEYEIVRCRVLSPQSTVAGTVNSPDGLIGFDLAYPGGDYYSAVRNGLLVNPHPELVDHYASRLNEYGLFSNTLYTEAFMNDFRQLFLSEAESEFVLFELYEAR
jgi:hypothetical protein